MISKILGVELKESLLSELNDGIVYHIYEEFIDIDLMSIVSSACSQWSY